MGLSYCEACQALEGNTETNDEGEEICSECGEVITQVPEHDDYDMER